MSLTNKLNSEIVWLASYPKSGNTWFRLFLDVLINNKREVDLTSNISIGLYSMPYDIEKEFGLDPYVLPCESISELRKWALLSKVKKKKHSKFYKIHDNFYTKSIPIIPLNIASKAIYFIRNPLDISVSYANFLSLNIESIVKSMLDDSFQIGSFDEDQFVQYVGSWSSHVESWLHQNSIEVKVVRYEDMLVDPFTVFTDCLDFISMPYNNADVENALRLTSFKHLKNLEKKSGFTEMNNKNSFFFKTGKSSNWQGKLTETQIKLFYDKFGELMKRFDYK